MGIPKFYRYISERWPTISQLVNGNVVPEFDNLYLDMNSIIHNCTHSNDSDNSNELTDEQMMIAIFNYIEHLFSIIKPQKVFYMAIDGVAPRAKMNQQRSRRFKSAKEAEQSRRKAIEEGVELPRAEPFDSNCITPGTEFMANLTVHLKYFINRKITEDASWRDIKIILSGHEVPGEGEHKIMNFLRSLRSEKGYDPNTAHCLYGLDADLIMLGLSSHETHFALLREEVVFGRQAANQSKELSEQRFHLLHLPLVREYMQLEFFDVLDEGRFDFERILDDFILINFFIGNDFLPEIPMLLINEGALPVIFETYTKYLLTVGDYISKNGIINFQNLKIWLKELGGHQIKKFEEEAIDSEWYNNELDDLKTDDSLVLTQHQKDLVREVKKFVLGCVEVENLDEAAHDLSDSISPQDLDFVGLLAHQTDMRLVETEQEDKSIKCQITVDTTAFPVDDAGKREWLKNTRKIFKVYEKAKLVDYREKQQELYSQKLVRWRNQYYRKKFHVGQDDPKVKEVAVNYLEGLQWVLFYYYRGCQSWGWYFHEHYAPMTSDLFDAIGDDFSVSFDPSTPFKPLEQLMSVLPDRSKALVPPAYRDLMTDETSPIIDFYPHDFDTDKNGKKADWQAVVLIPFIDEKRLVDALAKREHLLTPAEKKRNGRGTDLLYSYDPNSTATYSSPIPEVLPDIINCKCAETVINPHALRPENIVYGLLPEAKTGKNALAGFPSLDTLDYTFEIEKAEVRVFQQNSIQDSIVLTINSAYDALTFAEIAHKLVGTVAYIEYPFLREVKVFAVSNGEEIYTEDKKAQHLDDKTAREVNKEGLSIIKDYERTKAIRFRSSKVFIHCVRLEGLLKGVEGNYTKVYADKSDRAIFPIELVVENVAEEDKRFMERQARPVEEEYPLGSEAVLLLHKVYGSKARITGHANGKLSIEAVAIKEPSTSFPNEVAISEKKALPYVRAYEAARRFKVAPLFFSQITSGAMFHWGSTKFNIGMVLKKPSQNLKALGLTRKDGTVWEFSEAALHIVGDYLHKFRAPLQELSHVMKNGSSGIQDLKPIFEGKNLGFDMHKALEDMHEYVGAVLSSVNYVDISFETFSKGAISKIEFWSTEIASKIDLSKPVALENIHRGALMTFDMAQHQLANQKFYLGNRVMYALNYGKVAQFSRGVVIGIKQVGSSTSLEVVFDNEFDAGTTLDGRLKTKRGLLLDSGCLLNCTSKQLAYDRSTQFESATRLNGGAKKSQNSHSQRNGSGGHNASRKTFTQRSGLVPAAPVRKSAWNASEGGSEQPSVSTTPRATPNANSDSNAEGLALLQLVKGGSSGKAEASENKSRSSQRNNTRGDKRNNRNRKDDEKVTTNTKKPAGRKGVVPVPAKLNTASSKAGPQEQLHAPPVPPQQVHEGMPMFQGVPTQGVPLQGMPPMPYGYAPHPQMFMPPFGQAPASAPIQPEQAPQQQHHQNAAPQQPSVVPPPSFAPPANLISRNVNKEDTESLLNLLQRK